MFAVVLSMFLCGIAFATPFENILIVSIDALHPKALGPKTSTNIYKLMEKGTYTLNGNSTSPPLTLLSHTAMFTGLLPAQSGKTDNAWLPGQHRVKKETIFDTGKSMGFSTGFFYSKEKLGYLINDSIDHYKMSGDFAVEQAIRFFKKLWDKAGGKPYIVSESAKENFLDFLVQKTGLSHAELQFVWDKEIGDQTPEEVQKIKDLQNKQGG